MAGKWADGAQDSMAGSKEPKKEIKHIIVKKSHNGGHVMTHVHHHPSHPDETHTTKGDDAMVEHMLANAGTPNPGENTADPGSPAAMASAPMTPSPSPAPAPAGAPPAAGM